MSSHEPHVLSYGKLLRVLGALFVLTALTVVLSKVDLGALNIWLTLLIASTKSALVLMFFMHLKYEGKAFAVTLLVTVFTVAVFIGLMLWDVAYRSPMH